jgi:uncharacterized protein YqeY
MEARLRTALKEAMKSRDAAAISAIRSALGAVDNAGSVGDGDWERSPLAGSDHIAGSVQGLGAADVPRREIDDWQVVEIVRADVADRMQAAEQYRELGLVEEAARLESECKVLLRLLPSGSPG